MKIKNKKIGLSFILIGFFLPLFLLLFTSYYNSHSSLLDNILHMKIVLRSGSEIPITRLLPADNLPLKPTPSVATKEEIEVHVDRLNEILYGRERQSPKEEMKVIISSPISIPYKIIVAVGLIFIFMGIGLIIMSSNGKQKDI